LTFLSDFIAISNKLPTLQAYFQPKQEVTASIVFAMPQTYWDRAPNEKPAPPKTTGNHYVSPHGVTIYADGTPVPPDKKRPPSPTSDIVIAGLNRVDGIVPDSLSIRKKTPSLDRNHAMILVQAWPKRFFIKEWLSNFFTRNVKAGELQVRDRNNPPYVGDVYYSAACHKTLTLKAQIALIFDASAGAQPIVSTYILPISGWTWEINPQITETLEIDFAMRNQDNQALCNQLLTRSPIGVSKS
jgi:hypothetical protein